MTQTLPPLPCPRDPERAWNLLPFRIVQIIWTPEFIEPDPDEVLDVIPVPLFTVTEERTR